MSGELPNVITSQPLSPEEKQFLQEQRGSMHFRVFQKAINYFYFLEANALMQATDVDDLKRRQGVLQGLVRAKAIMALGYEGAQDLPKGSDKK